MSDGITREDMKYLYTHVLNEALKRSELPDSVFGVPEERKYPLETKEHVYSAVKLFNHVKPQYEEELANNIIAKMKEYNIIDVNPGPNNRFSKYYNRPVKESAETITRQTAIKNGGYYYDGEWNSIIELNGKLYRHRVECLIVDSNNKVYLQKKPDGSYRIPGGSTNNKVSDIDQVKNECLEEARIVVKNVRKTDKTYIIDQPPKKWMIEKGLPILWEGQYIDVYIADFVRTDKFFKPKDVDYDDMYKYGKFYDKSELNEIHLSALNSSITTESTSIVLEAPTDVDVEDDEVNDYTDDTDTEDTGDDVEEVNDEPNTYEDEIDDGEEDTADEPTDEEDTTNEDGFDEEPNDYTDDIDDGEGTDDDTGTETETTDEYADDTTTDDENNSLNNNNNIKNYNLLMDFQKLHTSLEDILANLKAASYKTSLQNSVLRRVLTNVETLKDEVLYYLEFNFSSNYTQNLYYFNTYIQLLKITLEMMKQMSKLDQDDK